MSLAPSSVKSSQEHSSKDRPGTLILTDLQLPVSSLLICIATSVQLIERIDLRSCARRFVAGFGSLNNTTYWRDLFVLAFPSRQRTRLVQ